MVSLQVVAVEFFKRLSRIIFMSVFGTYFSLEENRVLFWLELLLDRFCANEFEGASILACLVIVP